MDTYVTVGDERFAVQIFGDAESAASSSKPPIAFLLHGAGMSSASWQLCAEHMLRVSRAANPHGMVLCAPDLRGHGKTEAGQERGMSLEQLKADVCGVIEATLVEHLGMPASAPVYLIGHSLGGSISAKIVADQQWRPRVSGVVMLDIVEETALLHLKFMPEVLRKRPTRFESVEAAARWYVTEGGMKSLDAAMVSVGRTLTPSADGDGYEWRMDLGATADVWDGWIRGVNGNFLSTSAPKMLLVANTDRLDKGLTLAQMQGKFQFEIVRESGHHVEEDQPHAVAERLVRFITRVDTLTRKLPSVTPKRTDIPSPPPLGAPHPEPQ